MFRSSARFCFRKKKPTDGKTSVIFHITKATKKRSRLAAESEQLVIKVSHLQLRNKGSSEEISKWQRQECCGGVPPHPRTVFHPRILNNDMFSAPEMELDGLDFRYLNVHQ